MQKVRWALVVSALLAAEVMAMATGRIQVIGIGSAKVPVTTLIYSTFVPSKTGDISDAVATAADLIKAVRELNLPGLKIEQQQHIATNTPQAPHGIGGRIGGGISAGGAPPNTTGVLVTLVVQLGEAGEKGTEQADKGLHEVAGTHGVVLSFLNPGWGDVKKAERAAIKQAILDAREQAKALADQAGLTISGYEYYGFVPLNGGEALAGNGIKVTHDTFYEKIVSCQIFLVADY